jgi:hypothetical protein
VTASATPAATRPRQILFASACVAAAGVFGAIAALLMLAASTKQWLFEQTKTADLKSSSVKSGKTKMPSDAEIHHTVNKAAFPSALVGILVMVILFYVAYSLWKGKYWTRWGVIGAFVLLTFVSQTGGVNGLLLIREDAPGVFRVSAFLGSLALVGAVLMVNLKANLSFLALTRPERKPRPAGGGGGGLFGPRPSRETTPTRQPSSKSTASRAATKPATTRTAATRTATPRPADSRARSKARVDVTAPPPARARGKSRRTDVDKTS